jgi:ribosomal protein L37AE/L43A
MNSHDEGPPQGARLDAIDVCDWINPARWFCPHCDGGTDLCITATGIWVCPGCARRWDVGGKPIGTT